MTTPTPNTPGWTEGPWNIRPEPHEEGAHLTRFIGANIDENGGPLDGPTKNGGVWIARAMGRDADANARLIAASPALYGALEHALSRLERPHLSPDADVVIERIRRALNAANPARGGK